MIDENNNNMNDNNENIYDSYEEDDEYSVSKYQIDRRLKQAQLKRQVRHSKHQICLLLSFSRICLCIVLLFVIVYLFRLKYWRLNP